MSCNFFSHAWVAGWINKVNEEQKPAKDDTKRKRGKASSGNGISCLRPEH